MLKRLGDLLVGAVLMDQLGEMVDIYDFSVQMHQLWWTCRGSGVVPRPRELYGGNSKPWRQFQEWRIFQLRRPGDLICFRSCTQVRVVL